MRTMLRISMDVDAANRAISEGSMQRMLDEVMNTIHPEATYFTTHGGKRTAYMVFQLQDPSQIPMIAEPFFQKLRAELEFMPVMNRDEVMRGLQNFGAKKAA